MDYCLSECIYIWFEFSSSDIAQLGTSIGRSLQHEGKGDHQEEGGGGEGGDAGDGGRAEALDLWREEGCSFERYFNVERYLFERFCELRAQVAQVMAFSWSKKIIVIDVADFKTQNPKQDLLSLRTMIFWAASENMRSA